MNEADVVRSWAASVSESGVGHQQMTEGETGPKCSQRDVSPSAGKGWQGHRRWGEGAVGTCGGVDGGADASAADGEVVVLAQADQKRHALVGS